MIDSFVKTALAKTNKNVKTCFISAMFFGIIAHYYLQLSNYLIPGKTVLCIIEKLFIDQVN